MKSFRAIFCALLCFVIAGSSSMVAFASEEAQQPEQSSADIVEEELASASASFNSEINEEQTIESNFIVTLSRTEIVYVGTTQRPTVTVTDLEGTPLAYKKDFTVSYSDWNSTDVGEYTVTVNYVGEYEGSDEFTYNIIPQTEVTPTLNRTRINYTGTPQRPTVTLVDKYNRQLVYKKDFTVDYSDWNSTEAGTYKLIVNLIGNYSGTIERDYTISKCNISLNRTTISYVGTPQRPTVTVKDLKGNSLVYKTDFTVTYSDWNSTNVGTYTVTVNFIGKYTGSESFTYQIVPQTNYTVTLNRTDITYCGTTQRPTVTVKANGKTLAYKTDFTVSYADFNSTKVGAYTVTVNGIGNYGGTKTFKYYINEKNALDLNLSATHLSYEYSNVSKVVFGKSYQGRNLEAFIVTPANGQYKKTYVMTFAIHGFEDYYSRDGKVLVQEGNKLVEYYAKNPANLKNFRVIIIPCLNPDGTIAGTNNSRANSTAFGRCTAQHVDMNRDFPGFSAVESRALRDFLNKYRPDVFTDFHGWLDEGIGTPAMCNIFERELHLKGDMSGNYYSSYLYAWVHNTYGCPSTLIEYTSPNYVNHQQTYWAVNNVISYYN